MDGLSDEDIQKLEQQQAPKQIAPEHFPAFVKLARDKTTTPKKLSDYLKENGYPVPDFNQAASFLTQAKRNPKAEISPTLGFVDPLASAVPQEAQVQPEATPEQAPAENIDPMHPLQSKIINAISDIFTKPEYGISPEVAHALGGDLNTPLGANKLLPGAADLATRAMSGLGMAIEPVDKATHGLVSDVLGAFPEFGETHGLNPGQVVSNATRAFRPASVAERVAAEAPEISPREVNTRGVEPGVPVNDNTSGVIQDGQGPVTSNGPVPEQGFRQPNTKPPAPKVVEAKPLPKEEQDKLFKEWSKAEDHYNDVYRYGDNQLPENASDPEIEMYFKGHDAAWDAKGRAEAAYEDARGNTELANKALLKVGNRTDAEQLRVNGAVDRGNANDNWWDSFGADPTTPEGQAILDEKLGDKNPFKQDQTNNEDGLTGVVHDETPSPYDPPAEEPDLFGGSEPPKPPEGPPHGGGEPPEEPPETPSEKLNKILGGASKKLDEQAAARKQELSDRIAEGRARADGKEGESAFAANLSALKGKRVIVKGEDIAAQLTQDDVEGLFKQLQSHYSKDFFGGINAFNGLKRMLEGDLPRPSELRLIEEAFGAETTKNIMAHRAEIKKIFNGEGGQREMFKGEETLSTGPIRTLGPEEKPIDPDKFVDSPRQGDLFKEKPGAKPKVKAEAKGPDQGELFSGGEVTSTGPVRGDLAPEPRPVDPEKFIDDPKQGDFFKEKPKFSGGGKGPPKPPSGTNAFINAMSLPKALRASYDLSAPFRQGIFLVGRKEFYQAIPTMLKQFVKGWGKSDEEFNSLMASIKAKPSYPLMEKAGLHLTEVGDNLTKNEEAYMSSWAERIPGIGRGVKASEKAYSGYLNKLRSDVFERLVQQSKEAGIDFEADPKALTDIASFINNATGRGSLGWFNKSAPLLNTMFFSPRLISARATMLNPVYYAKLSPVVRREALKSLLSFTAIAGTVMSLAVAGGANVELDPRSSDFLKIKTGNTRYDVTGGFGAYLRLGAILASGQTKSLSGKVTNLGEGYKPETRMSVEAKFLRSKLSPAVSYFLNSQAGSDVVGNKFNAAKDGAELLVPLIITDAYDLLKDGRSPAQAAAMAAPSIVGVGTQTFQPRDKPAKPMAHDPANLFQSNSQPLTDAQIEEMDKESSQPEPKDEAKPLTDDEIQKLEEHKPLTDKEIPNALAKDKLEQLGYHVTDSGVRSHETQERYYATTKGVAKPGTSPHEDDRAIDVRPHRGANPQEIKQALVDEGYTGVKIITKRHGTGPHWHVQWQGYNG